MHGCSGRRQARKMLNLRVAAGVVHFYHVHLLTANTQLNNSEFWTIIVLYVPN